MKLFDAHCHYNDEKFDIDRDMLIKEVHDSGVEGMINAGYSFSGSVSAVDLSNKYDFIYATVGISPNDVTEDYISDIEKIEELLIANLNSGKIVAIGEIGLDYHYDVDRDMQKDAFIRQIKLANKYDLPIVIHTREATVDTINILKENPVNKVGMFHCCPLNQELVKEALKLGFYISVCGPITFKNSKNAEVIANMIPLDRILVETDSPYLSPEPLRGRRNDSRNIKYIVEKIANFKKVEPEVVMDSVFENIKRCFPTSGCQRSEFEALSRENARYCER